MISIETQYHNLLDELLNKSNKKDDRTGTGTLSVFGRQIRHNMSEGFPLLTTKKMAVKTMMTELKWFLKGDTNIKYLVDNGCNIWNGDSHKAYITAMNKHYIEGGDVATQKEFINLIKEDDEFAGIWGELGPIYGAQWRSWRVGKGIKTTLKTEDNQVLYEAGSMYIDQIKIILEQLKTNPDSRRMIVSAWNVGELDGMTLPPCHYGFQVYTRELSPMEVLEQAKKDGIWDDGSGFDGADEFSKNSDGELFHEYLGRIQSKFKTRAISLMWNQRSVDTLLGLPFNIASYGALLCLLANEVNMVPEELIGSLGDVHLYSNHIKQAKEQLSREAYELPTVEFTNIDLLAGEFDFKVNNYKSHAAIKAPLSN